MDEDSYAEKFVEDEPSFYEKVRSANIAANDAFLKQLGITPLVPPENKKRKRHPIAVQPELGNRKSARNHNTVNQTMALRGDEAEATTRYDYFVQILLSNFFCGIPSKWRGMVGESS